MAIKLERDVGGSGVTAEYWVLSSVHRYREGNTEVFSASAQYDLYLNAEAFKAGKAPLRRSAAQVLLSELPADDAHAELMLAFDAQAIAPAVEAVYEDVDASASSAVVVDGGAAEAGSEVEVEARPARRVERKLVTPAKAGGPLSGGEIVD